MGVGRPRVGRSEVEGGGGVGKGGGAGCGCDILEIYRGWLRYVSRMDAIYIAIFLAWRYLRYRGVGRVRYFVRYCDVEMFCDITMLRCRDVCDVCR